MTRALLTIATLDVIYRLFVRSWVREYIGIEV